MKTFKEILTEHWRKSGEYEPERDAEFIEFCDSGGFKIVTDAVEEYRNQYICGCKKEEVKEPTPQLDLFNQSEH